jgi:hypothetical protein
VAATVEVNDALGIEKLVADDNPVILNVNLVDVVQKDLGRGRRVADAIRDLIV